jgi:hypothetical protein
MRWIFTLILPTAVAVGIGFGLYLLDTVGFYLVLLMPMLAGIIVGFFVCLPTARRGAPGFPLVVIALLTSLVMMGAYWYFQYDHYLTTIIEAVQEQNSSVSREKALELIDQIQMETYNATGFVAFVMDYAEVGFNIGRVGSSDSSNLQIQGTLAYIFWAGEILIAVVSAVVTVLRRGSNKTLLRMRRSEPDPNAPTPVIS